ncbi:deoxyuridine 5'-triphosphate nucleotidohydrolase [Listeria phage List-36]|uniref:dUTP diphosphatase n=16 Tax=Pecentumvirus TaxID=1857844 RepID=S4U6X0_9CAUD|nr:gp118 [Listeria phage A511]YP_008240098.1 putative deoxyuridine 5'-triphosphate nucleotidohydrolase [Listeria phage LP-125]YP_009043126.1 putative deoxyuridine 5'-triphosphate nucleotidohydrolase [Listeria phage LMSP-25]YP_009043434.1 deoxyuridine 5'-triphosphate nucleotidohydrolase [Listeria phage List-36]YP_009044588.1 putative deoxyuridine 5'-triphosphate nucleotidohydrolase [Listeria phage LP-083-2]YP_009592665.1 putative deoxyuridine 5'-triphosphate nucleotidohydrolase [Listeria phage 
MSNKVNVKVKLEGGATMPSQGYDNDVAFDLYTSEDAIICPDAVGATLIPTGLRTEFDPTKFGLFISPRSSIMNLPLTLANNTGIVEGTYRGGIGIPLKNTLSMTGFSDFALTWNPDKKVVERIPVEKLPTGKLRSAEKMFYTDQALLYDNTLPEELADQLFVTLVPTGTFFLPKGFRIMQAYLLPKYHLDLEKTDKLSDSPRGDKGFGSSGHGGK